MKAQLSRWRRITGTPYSWLPAFNTIMQECELPSLSGDTVYATSDYSGTHKTSKYKVISVLVASLEGCREWELKRREVRARFLADGRRMSFKALGDRQRSAALLPFLHAAGTIDGLLASVIIDKDIKGLITTRTTLKSLQDRARIRGRWNIYEFEEMARVAHFVSVFVAGLIRPNQNVIWISDEDEVLANDDRKMDCAGMISSFTSSYVPHPLGELQMGTTALDEGDLFEEDLAAIPDLIAGSLADVASDFCQQPEWFRQEKLITERSKKKSTTILAWLSRTSKRLHHTAIVFEGLGAGAVALFPFEVD